MKNRWIPEDDWRTIIENIPIVSVDLLVRYEDGLLFGKRTNEPAKGHWFLPGGRVQKGETRPEAVQRIAAEELGVEVRIVESLGAFEHIYDTSELKGVDMKHYLASGYVVDVKNGKIQSDDQHSELRVFRSSPEPLHENICAYLEASEILAEWP